jgi:HlyD family secretion protein
MKRARLAGLLSLGALLAVGGFWAGRASSRRELAAAAPGGLTAPGAERTSVVAMARLEPGSRILSIGPAGPEVVGSLLVKEGETVESGRELAHLRSYGLRRIEEQAARVRLDQARLKTVGVEGQRAQLRAREAALEHARSEVARVQGLLERGLVSERERDQTAFDAQQAGEELKQAQATLSEVAQAAELAAREAEESLRLAHAQLEQAILRAPVAGRVLDISAQPGERVTGPFIRLGATENMDAVAEVHATDLHFVKLGQRASFSSPSLPAPVQGRVTSVGAMVSPPGIFGEDPSRATNSKIFQVRIRLDPDLNAAGFSNLEGEVRIEVGDSGRS